MILISVTQNEVTETEFNLIGLSGIISLILTFIISRFPKCTKCQSRSKPDSFHVSKYEIEKLISTYSLKKPIQYKYMVNSKSDWKFHVIKCEKCDYNQVIFYSPHDYG